MEKPRIPKIALLCIIAITGLILASSAFGLLRGRSGIIPASYAEEQEIEDASANVEPAVQAPAGMDSVSDLVEDQPMSKEVRDALHKRELAVADKERELAQRQRDLENLKQEIEAKLAQLEVKRQALQELTAQIDSLQDDAVTEAANIYKLMPTEEAAQLFNEMDLGLVAKVLKRLSPIRAGELLAAMVADVERTDETTDGTESTGKPTKAERLRKLRDLNEIIVDPLRLSNS